MGQVLPFGLAAASLVLRFGPSRSLLFSPRLGRARHLRRSTMASCTLNSGETSGTETAKCVPCSSLDKSALLTRPEVEQQLETLPLWTLQENSDDQALFLSRKFVAKNFQCALDSLNQMGAIAEREGHHPDFHLTSYREVEVNMWTHKLNGITQNDIQLAHMLDTEVDVVYSPKWLRDNPSAAKQT